MDQESRVVALVKPEVLTNTKTGMHAARILALGLTAYGNTQDEALRKVKFMYASAVQAHRELGTLEGWLNRSGLNWFWFDEYKGAVPVENADGVPEKTEDGNKAVVNSKAINPWHNICDLYPMAA